MLARFTFSVIREKKDGSSRLTNADLKICQYLRLQIKMICRRFHINTLRFEICAHEICKKFVHNHLETIEYVKD